jgi:hypothetical protein
MSNLSQPINPFEDVLRASMEYTPAFQIRQLFQMVARRGPNFRCVPREERFPCGLTEAAEERIVFLPLARLLRLTTALSLSRRESMHIAGH